MFNWLSFVLLINTVKLFTFAELEEIYVRKNANGSILQKKAEGFSSSNSLNSQYDSNRYENIQQNIDDKTRNKVLQRKKVFNDEIGKTIMATPQMSNYRVSHKFYRLNTSNEEGRCQKFKNNSVKHLLRRNGMKKREFDKKIEDKQFKKIKHLLEQDYDYNNALIDVLAPNNERKLPPDFKLIYDEDRDPLVIFNGETERFVYHNTERNLPHLSGENNHWKTSIFHSDINSRKFANPSQTNKRYIHLLHSMPMRNKQILYNSNKSYISYLGSEDTLNWKPSTSNYDKMVNKVSFRKQNKINITPLNWNYSSPVNWNHGQLIVSNNLINEKMLMAQTTESYYGTPLPMHPSNKVYHKNISLTLPQLAEVLPSKAKSSEPSVDSCLTNVQPVAMCHPSGGPPKFLRDSSRPNSKDKEYNGVLSGELTEKIVQKILAKASKNARMCNEFGLSNKNLTEMRTQYINVSSTGSCCTPLYGEMKCFLSWLITVDLTRKPRSRYFNVKPERNFLFDDVFVNPWSSDEKMNSIALPPSMYGFAQQPMYSFGKEHYTSKLFHELPEEEESNTNNRLIYRSKVILFPEDGE